MTSYRNAILGASLLLFITSASAQEIDEQTGLVIDTHWETVKIHCTVCHSAKLITAQRGSRETWQEIIRWMQATQGLWQFPEETENHILDYLAKHYPPGDGYRRKPLSPLLMPANPYEGES
jgi:hypothetical protein